MLPRTLTDRQTGLTPCCMLPCDVSLPWTGAPRGCSHQAAPRLLLEDLWSRCGDSWGLWVPRWSARVWLVLFPMVFRGHFLPVVFVTVFLIWSGGTVLITSVQARFVFLTFILLAWRQQWLVGTFRTEHGHFGLRGTALSVCVCMCACLLVCCSGDHFLTFCSHVWTRSWETAASRVRFKIAFLP